MGNKHSQFMKLAISKAWKNQFHTYPNPAVGATVVLNGKVLSVQSHENAGEPHAEVLALKEAYLTVYSNSKLKELISSEEIHQFLTLNHNDFFKTCEIYVTLEPCNHIGKTPACAMLLESIGIKKVYIGTLDPNKKASGGVQRLRDADIEVDIGVCKELTDELLYPFTLWQKNKFIFFKLAMRIDGSIDGGYITTKESLEKVHDIRTKIDCLAIGGETVRIDRPTLDARFAVINKAPDILIYSKQQEFDKTIPLFDVKNRELTISNDFDISKYKFVMVEGGFNLLKSIEDKIDYLLLFISHKSKKENIFDYKTLGFKKVYSYNINEFDEIVFLKRITVGKL
ncbi:MAG: bifunctional diaminohydroxyphosphoribosylaminopyrimidine deaminase/5-amino-6-(5-phosphoribosylamino)uracil reductase RibD [Campylobacterota bacterium]|nr:bifunctional diaminohydroxyphosphoribosylaminopyrimidine deaminase/5-amino-6-(5-phosphoribosylamino)uracil reductase RibD [Campylobacterota bacterium]